MESERGVYDINVHSDRWCVPSCSPANYDVITFLLSHVGFSALRMYAIYEKDRRILACVLTLGLVNPCVNIVSILYSLGYILTLIIL